MSNHNRHPASMAGLVLCTALSVALTGCLVDAPSRGRVYAARPPAPSQQVVYVNPPPPPVEVRATVMVQDNYVYYPGYEVYYSSNRRQYVYQDGTAWVTRPAPPRVSVAALFASPSVAMDFHDAPAIHHENTVRSYPKNWTPQGKGHDAKDDRNDDKNDDKRDDKKDRN